MDKQLELAEQTCRDLLFALFCQQKLQPVRGFETSRDDLKAAFWFWLVDAKRRFHVPLFTEAHLDACLFKMFYTHDILNFKINTFEYETAESAALAQLRKSSIS